MPLRPPQAEKRTSPQLCCYPSERTTQTADSPQSRSVPALKNRQYRQFPPGVSRRQGLPKPPPYPQMAINRRIFDHGYGTPKTPWRRLADVQNTQVAAAPRRPPQDSVIAPRLWHCDGGAAAIRRVHDHCEGSNASSYKRCNMASIAVRQKKRGNGQSATIPRLLAIPPCRPFKEIRAAF